MKKNQDRNLLYAFILIVSFILLGASAVYVGIQEQKKGNKEYYSH